MTNFVRALPVRVVVCLAAALLLASCGSGSEGGAGSGQSAKPPSQAAAQAPPSLKAVKVKPMDVPIYVEFVSRTEAEETVEVRARVEGFLQQRHFQEGSLVQQGDLLFTIDPSQYREAVNQSKAELERNLASLEQAETDVERFRKLYEQGAVSREEFDNYRTTMLETKATVAQNRAALAEAKLNLGYTRVYAPISGRAGRAQVKQGALVGKGENTLLATISSVDPIYVNFSISEDQYLYYVNQVLEGKRDPGESTPLTLVLADKSVYPHTGRLNMADRAVDPQTGTLGVRAVFPNPRGLLRPGQFARVVFAADQEDGVLVVPKTAVNEIQGAMQVYVAAQNGTVTAKSVEIGRTVGDNVIVDKGLETGDVVLIEGLQKIKPGMVVDPKPVEIEVKASVNATLEG